MHPIEEHHRLVTRRQFFGRASGSISAGLGIAALTQLEGRVIAAPSVEGPEDAVPHFAPKCKRVIYLHQMGAPSQLDLFDYKPKLVEMAGKDLRKMPDVWQNQRVTGMTSGQSSLPLVPSRFRFDRYDNESGGTWISELLPHTAAVADKLCIVRSMFTEAINHEPGITFLQTGSQIPGRPAIGSWLSYGLGSANSDLPSFVVLISQGFGNMQALSARMWGSGFLPSEHQGVRLRSGKDPVLFLDDPKGMKRSDRRRMLDAVVALNEMEYERCLDEEVRTRISQAEMAFRMQMSVPELTDFSSESAETLELYGPDVHKPGSFAANCLLARRLAERDVRFIQLYQRGWDAHGNLPKEITLQAKAVDRAQAALIQDLDRRGLLDDTLVVWGGEFGRTAYCQGAYNVETYGRDHHPRCFTMWFAGGGIRQGIDYGSTDDFGYNVLTNPVHVHDMHATMMHLLGIDHERLTYRYQGRRYRLTDIAGRVVHDILA
ncbi:MAG: DUF1501 domain-containing protein [Planctomycetes bacterium]|nr:DUF1501 domain-containing protein [Planctomycetota bacterium]MCB9918757.1 DUF1501 domain-containing protein [Planctomycetota bacterium]